MPNRQSRRNVGSRWSKSNFHLEQLLSTRAAVIDKSDDGGAAQEAKPAKSPKAPSAATATKSKKSRAMATIIVTMFHGDWLPEPQASGQLPLAPIMTKMKVLHCHRHDRKNTRKKSARERKADKEYQLTGKKQTIKLNESNYGPVRELLPRAALSSTLLKSQIQSKLEQCWYS
ncbi:hypothetical protein DFH08DRAFT_817121 [Mycena albidolilacea]|uniref:Uncharacterized protein n=1 Tax=Mycena albidolilacea TaxID=1033008 RepID=A0AAD6ZJV9_9AGAR|nr:hypothetical protein DFH08DRAFT_817121 [Mycena albidolilacea]